MQEALGCAQVAQNYLSRLRNEPSFAQFYALVVKEAEEYTEAPVLPRYRRPPRRLDEGAAPHQFETPEMYYRSLYFEALDLVSEQMLTRFSQESMSIPKDLEKLLMKAANEQTISTVNVPDNLLSVYSKDIDFERAKLQLQMLPDLVKAYKQSQGVNRLEITSMRTIADILNKVPIAKDMFSEVDTLLRLYFTVPITTCTAERSFSCLRRTFSPP